MSFGNWFRELLGMTYTAILGALFYFSPAWDPLSGATGQRAALMMAALFLLNLIYLLMQSWPLVQGKVGTSFGLMTDFVFSILPVLPVVLAIAFHMGGFAEQSFTNLVIGGVTLGVVVFDIVIFGGIGSLVNRLTTDFYRGRGGKD